MAGRPKPPPYRPDLPLWVRAVALFVPVAFLALGLALAAETMAFLGDSTRTIGLITSVRLEQDTRRGNDGFSETVTTEWPTVRYAGPDGAWRENEVAIALGFGAQAEGERVWVRYDDARPDIVRLDRGFWDHWLGPIAFSLVGGGATLGLLWLFRVLERVNRTRFRVEHGVDP
ncbi:DUF3592 domain-containing protein [Limibaculum sp. M0105]|uniref:DUF3592 domain-containing protein n=1 Tax=Thermohalobaculum xanthum TaxID=2753746 RepID=A0A8J7M5L8_9RHOB|nr:DUF3592 domain-containing protein [Thermohalobaculum xanthum]MBK0398936.1 DUF3592 domain-containing protein [Thermohalobaculum xanthum]